MKKKLLISTGLLVVFAAATVYACCGVYPSITDDPIEPVCAGDTVTISGGITGVAWAPVDFTTDARVFMEVVSPSGVVTQMDAVLSNLVIYPDGITATYDFSAAYTTAEAGIYTYVKTVGWTSTIGEMLETAIGEFEAMDCVVPSGKVTGGGWFSGQPGRKNKDSRNTFGLVAMYDEETGDLHGSLQFQSHGDKINVHSTEVTNLVVDGVTATIEGTCRVNGEDGSQYICTVVDNGEPGRGNDTIQIEVVGKFNLGPVLLNGGNIQIHE